ncbi:hypothetical protein K6H11_002116 [Candida tropicalis]
MDFMNQMYHDLKFHVNHFIVGYRQKYYSMDNNPRVIHTKLENQQLLSLRTFPNDKSLISKGQHFLHLNRKLDHENEEPGNLSPSSSSSSSSTINSLDNVVKREFIAFENYKNVTFRTHNSLILKKNYSEPNLVDGYFSSFRLDLEMSGSSSEADASGEEEVGDKGEVKEGEEEEGEQQQQVVSDQPLISLETETPGVTDCTSSTPCTCQCHVFEKPAMESTNSSTRKSNHVKDKLYNFVMNSLPRVSGNSNNNETTCDSNDIKVKEETHVVPPAPQQAENSIDEIMSMKQDNNKIWKLVLNDISLSAARLSTGSGTIPMVNNQNIRGDFIDARIMNNENEDIFTTKSVPPSK